VRKGIEPILQITCRDRNRVAIQGDLPGAAAPILAPAPAATVAVG
jgi:5,10-methylenetetrahydrofolate reductase